MSICISEQISEQIASKHEQTAREARRAAAVPGCQTCLEVADTDFGPSHDGSLHCESGSIASGGQKLHCTCDLCF